MINLSFSGSNQKINSVLCLGAHSDDIEIGCGGTILSLLQSNPDLNITWVVFSSNEIRKNEAFESAGAFLEQAASKDIRIEKFKDGYFPYMGAEMKDYFEELKSRISPDVVFTHFRHDLHQDHRLVCDLTWNTFRNHFILEYEIPKYDGDLGSPNCFSYLSKQVCQQKVDLLLKCFKSQRGKKWFTEDLFFSLMRLRGMESAAPEGLSEAFYSRKSVIKF